MQNLLTKKLKVEDMIYEIRGHQVMLASDVAKLYQSETKVINQVVKRNLNRFPEEFCFQLTKEETKELCSRSQIVTLNNQIKRRGQNIKYLPYVFTEHGIMMLSGLLKSDIAAQVNIIVIHAFVAMRKYIGTNLLEQQYINKQVMKNTENIELLQESFAKLEEKEKVNHIFFEGQVYDAYSLFMDIVKMAKEEIIIIDNYAGKELFDLLRNIKIPIKVITSNLDEKAYQKYQKQYIQLEILSNSTFHDRFILLDRKILYTCGASFKDLGHKCFALTKIEDEEILESLKKRIFVSI